MLVYMPTKYGTFIRMDSKAIRKIRLKQLIARVRGDGGNQADVARRVQTDPAYLSQILGKEGREVGDELARRLEKAFKMPHGWMDTLGEQGAEVSSQVMGMALEIDDLPQAQKEAIKTMLAAFKNRK